MKLVDYLQNGISQAEFGRSLKDPVSQGMVSQWLAWLAWRDSGSTSEMPANVTRVTAERALQIDAATGGQVSRNYLRPDIFSEAPATKQKARAA